MLKFLTTFVIVLTISFFLPTKSFGFHFEHNLINEFKFYKDSTSSKSIDEIIKIEKWNKTTKIAFGYSKSTYWIKLNLKKHIKDNQNYLVVHDYLTDSIQGYYVKNSNVIKKESWGLKESLKNKNIEFRKASFLIDKNHTDTDLYIKFSSQNYPISASIEIYDEKNFYKSVGFDNALINIFFIIILIMLFYHSMLYFITKVTFYKYYSIYLILLVITTLFSTNYLHLYFFKEGLNNFGIFFFQLIGFIMVISLVVIMKPYLKINTQINKILNLNLLLPFLLFIAGKVYLLVVGNINENISLLLNYAFIILIFTVVFILIKTYRKTLFSTILILMWFPLFFMFLLFSINLFYIFIDVLFIEYLNKLVFIYETIIISLIIAYKLKNTKQENIQLELKTKENEIFNLRTKKLAAMGEMINNITHQWKQPLARVNSILFDMNFSLETCTKKDFQNSIDLIENEVNNMSKTISSFSNYFQPNKEKSKFSINKVIKEQIEYFKNDFQENKIKYSIDYTYEDIVVEGLKEEYVQVITVIIQNAIDSFNIKKIQNPRIKFIIKKIKETPLLEIENNGEQIKEENLEKIFEPYFTTKNNNNNTGIGLYMAKMLIEDGMKKKLEVSNTSYGVKFSIIG